MAIGGVVAVALAILGCLPYASSSCQLHGQRELEDFQRTHNDTMSDLIFLVDTSGSLQYWSGGGWKNGFDDEKVFVNSLLSHIRVSYKSTYVSVVLFGTSATIDINYIFNPHPNNHKCNFRRDFSNLRFRSGMTNMHDAFQAAYDIIFGKYSGHKRPTHQVKTAVFLLTDGQWNWNGDPWPIAKRLKDRGIEIFTIGVTNGVNVNTLRSLASPNNYFHYNDFTQFRELATCIRGDPYDSDWLIVGDKSKCQSCDLLADCACGLVSGKYRCACPKGYYGSGYTQDCHKCGPSTYKDFVGYAKTCTPCPANSVHTRTGSDRKSHCVCKEGFDGSPAQETPCTIMRCQPIPIPANGYEKGGSCSNEYGATCEVACHKGFELTAPGMRSCVLNSHGGVQWSGTEPMCRQITCQALDVANAIPRSGKCVPDGSSAYGTNCTITCSIGYIRKGLAWRVCQQDKTWSGEDTVCEEIRCPMLNSISLAQVNPATCVSRDQRFSTVCRFECPRGYEMKKSKLRTLSLTCGLDGQWNGKPETCDDVEAPEITCPQDMTVNNEPQMSYAEVTWDEPIIKDNSQGNDPNAKIEITKSHTSPKKFEIGKNQVVTYSVKDGANLTASCNFRVTVQDTEPPTLKSCPADQTLDFNPPPLKQTMRVFWTPPTYTDNSKVQPKITGSSESSDEFALGEKFVNYEAKDAAGNVNRECVFKIHLKTKGCPNYPPPKNGALACNAWGAGSKYCTVSCTDTRDFAFKPAMAYLCSNANWQTYPYPVQMPWPDCSLRYDPSEASQRMMAQFYYYSGDCNSEEAQEQIKTNFLNLAKFGFIPPFISDCTDFHVKCTVKNVNVFCGETDKRKRRRRSAVKEVYIKVDFVGAATSSVPRTLSQLENVMETQTSPRLDSTLKAVDWSPLRANSDLEFKKFSLTKPEGYCSADGAVVGKCDSYGSGCLNTNTQSQCSCNGDSGKIEKCIRCPAGTYYDSLHEKCMRCKPGTYSSHEGSLKCYSCPEGSWTLGDEAKNFTSCTEKCKPGYYSSTGLARCTICPRGEYASGHMNKKCTPCPQGTTSVLAAATSREECGMMCAPGTYSSSGVEPCLPCPKGTYQTAIGQMSCSECPGTKSTHGPGADSHDMCLDIDNCASSPCQNGGRCESLKDDFRCACPGGFTGRRCETEQDECLSDPCYQGSTCIDKVNGYECICAAGYSGPNCDVISGLCSSSRCQNGAKCVAKPPSGACECPEGYGGLFCERKMDFCVSAPCKNGGLCRSLQDKFQCNCRPGFSGDRCEIDIDDCAKNPCLNNGACVDQVNGYTCTCKAGFAGSRCDRNVDNCYPNPCVNGVCKNKVNGYECACNPGYSGSTCATKVSSDFDLHFPLRVVTSSSSTSNIPDLTVFTIAFWMRTTDRENPGTPISYATTVNGEVIDNALVLQDYGAFTLHVNNKKQFIGVSANDGHWHHVAVTWQSLDGAWAFYLDGKKMKSSFGFQTGAVIKGGGVMVLGQEQDTVGDGFNAEEAFTGDISQMNVWNTFLTDKGAQNLVHSCQAFQGNVKAWGDFRAELQGLYVITPKSYACDASSKIRGYRMNHEARVLSRQKTLSSQTPEQCAASCEQEVTFPCRSFEYNRANKDCHLSKMVVTESSDIVPTSGIDVYQSDCVDPLGVGAKGIKDSAMTASSSFNPTAAPEYGRLQSSRIAAVAGLKDSYGGWRPSSSNNQQFLQVDLGEKTRMTGVATQGADGSSQWVTSYKLEYSADGSKWTMYAKVLTGNTDDKTIVRQQVQSFSARYVRFRPQAWSGEIAMRVEIYGCKESVPVAKGTCVSNSCTNGGTCVDLPNEFKCVCPSGYEGRRCEHASGCPSPKSPTNGKIVSSTGSGHGSSVTVTCNAGFKLTGDGVRTCNHGRWTGNDPQCVDINECNSASSPCAQQCTNTEGSFTCSCNPGYNLGSDGVTCNDVNECSLTGICSHKCYNTKGSFRCECPAGMELAAGGRSCQDKDECAIQNGGCEHACANGYLRSTCQCRGGYNLESDIRSCAEIHCPVTTPPTGGKETIHGARILGNVLSITCNPGYRLVGPSTRTCQADGKWSGSQPRCEAVQCVDIGTIKKGARTLTAGHSYGSRAQFSCISGYALEGVAQRSCQQDGTWTGVQPRCVRADCPALNAPVNGKIEGNRREVGSTVRVSCATGYRVKPEDGAFRTCGSDKRWTGSDPTCILVDCGDPGTPFAGSLIGSTFTYNSVVRYQCRVKHHLEGDASRKCGADGKWTGKLPTCLERSCGEPGTPLHGNKVGTNHTYGASVKFVCNQGYQLQGVNIRTCEESTGKWTGSQPTCKIRDCGDPGAIVNGFRIGHVFTYGSSVTYDCNPGFKLQGSITRQCQADGTWTGSTASCTASNCGQVVTGPFGTIQSTNFPNNYENNEYCTWEIRVPTGKKVRLDFTELRTEEGKDLVIIYDTGKTDPIIAFSGLVHKPRALTSSGNTMRVRFISNGENVNNGFKLKYSQTDCGGMLTTRTGGFTSPNFPQQYPDSASCIWLIHMPNTQIALQTPEFSTENAYDRLEIAHGPWVTSPLEIAWSGPSPVSGDVVTKDYMWVHFYSNSRNDRFYKGFRATYKPYDPYANRR